MAEILLVFLPVRVFMLQERHEKFKAYPAAISEYLVGAQLRGLGGFRVHYFTGHFFHRLG